MNNKNLQLHLKQILYLIKKPKYKPRLSVLNICYFCSLRITTNEVTKNKPANKIKIL